MVADHKSESYLRRKYWDEQKSQVEIASELEISDKTVSRWMKKHNIETRSNSERQSDGDVEKLMNEEWLREQYINQEKSTPEIAEELEVHDSSVRRWMNKHSIESRSKSERQSEGNIEKLRSKEWLKRQYRNKQKSQVEIADELDVCTSTVTSWMDEHGIESRSKSESLSDGDIEKLEDEEWLRKQYENQQKTTHEIADELDVCSKTVSRWMKKHNIETRPKSERHSDGDIEKLMNEKWLREQYENQRKSSCEIADELDVCTGTVTSWMDKHGIESRPKSEIQSEGNVEKLWDENWLRKEYENQRKSSCEIADELGVACSTVRSWMCKHNIDVRPSSDGDTEKLRDGDWLREQYENQQKTIQEISSKLKVGNTTVRDWLKRHEISTRSSIIDPEHTTHIVRSEWELEVCSILIEEGVDYNYESLEIEYCEGSTYHPDFVTDEYVIEVKGAYFSEIHGHENTERGKALATMESLEERDYVVVGKELPADIHIPWEERSKIRELF